MAKQARGQNTPIHYYTPRTVKFVAGIPQNGIGNVYSNRARTNTNATVLPGIARPPRTSKS